ATAGADFETVGRANDDLAAILYTSGTTGRSKGAMLTHDNLASNSVSLVDYWRFSPGDVLIHALPIYHTHGLFVASNVTLFALASPARLGIRCRAYPSASPIRRPALNSGASALA